MGAACSVIPDVDVVAFEVGISHDRLLGHRGLSHSLLFATLLGGLSVALFFRNVHQFRARAKLFVYFTAATASHGLLDAMTDGGLGVAFFAPFSSERYFFPWRPIKVSPIGATAFFSQEGAEALLSELIWLWLPAVSLIAGSLWLFRRSVGRASIQR